MHVFNVLNNYFDKIWVLSLNTATERRVNIEQLLDGLNFSFFEATDKSFLYETALMASKVYDKALAQQYERYSKPMSLGQIACALSHKRMYELIINNGYNRTLILEDDVEPIHENISKINDILKALPDSWELLYFDYSRNEQLQKVKQYWYHIIHALGGLKWSHQMIRNLYAKPYNKYLNIAGYHDYTDAYAITLDGAEKLLAMQTPLAYVADNLLAHACSGKRVEGYISLPKLFLQTSQGAHASLSSSLH
jgi:glycosyl transferase, family 25